MFHQTVDLKYKNNSQKIYYAEAFEMVNGKIRLKEGIDPEWANYHVDHTVVSGETPESIAEKYGITKEELYKRNKLKEDAVILPGDVLEIGRSRQFKAFKNRMHEITNRLEGAFAKFDRVELDRNFFFQIMIFMKRYFGHMAGNWFAGRRTSAALGDISIGNWPGFVKTIGGLFKYGTGYTQFQRSEEKAAAKRMLGMILTVAAFYMLRSFLWDWDFLEDSDEAYEKMKNRSGDYFSDSYRRQGFISNSYLALMMGVLTETETWTNPVVFINQVKGLPDPGTVSDQALIKPTLIISEYLAYLNKDKSAFYKQDSGPYSWQKEGEPKWKATFMKMLGFTGANFDPKKGIENQMRYQRSFTGTK
jgi:DNA-directed RNA polymerase subunit H (RpoH/RPB5)